LVKRQRGRSLPGDYFVQGAETLFFNFFNMGLLKVLGLDWRILIAQLVNFSVLLFVLYKFAYKPMFKLLDERKKKIEEGIENAVLAEERLRQIESREQEIMKNAKKEAAAILQEARREAEENKLLAVEKAREEIGKVINQEKENIHQEKAEVLKSIKKEVAGLVAMSLEKLLGEKMDNSRDQDLIKRALSKLK
jgi:F-type H+-transporting ATPase subunit b